MHDNLLNPFDSLSDETSFLSVKQTNFAPEFEDENLLFSIEFVIDNKVRMVVRERYSFWQALSDIGGFHDGLTLLLKLLMMPFARALFNNDLVQGGLHAK